jgi:hypothetical protein
MKQAQRWGWEETLPLGHGTRRAREGTATRVVTDVMRLSCGPTKRGVGGVRQSKYATRYNLGPYREILQSCSEPGVK